MKTAPLRNYNGRKWTFPRCRPSLWNSCCFKFIPSPPPQLTWWINFWRLYKVVCRLDEAGKFLLVLHSCWEKRWQKHRESSTLYSWNHIKKTSWINPTPIHQMLKKHADSERGGNYILIFSICLTNYKMLLSSAYTLLLNLDKNPNEQLPCVDNTQRRWEKDHPNVTTVGKDAKIQNLFAALLACSEKHLYQGSCSDTSQQLHNLLFSNLVLEKETTGMFKWNLLPEWGWSFRKR